MIGQGRQKAAQTRHRIIAKAIELFAKHGFQATSFQQIATPLNITQPAIAYHFRNKKELFVAAIHQVVVHNHEIVDSAIRPEDSALQRLEKHFEQHMKWALENPAETQIILLLYYFAAQDIEITKLYQKLQSSARKRIETYLLAGIREGDFPKKLNTRKCAELLHDMLLGIIVNAVTTETTQKHLGELRSKWKNIVRALT